MTDRQDGADPLSGYLAGFKACYDRYLAEVPDQTGNMLLKHDHCLRVLAEARMITAALVGGGAMDAKLERLVHIAALLHDVGRFPQLVRYGTFRDPDSESHGALGVRAIRRCGLLEGETVGDARVVRATVAMHNRLHLPEGLTGDIRTALDVVRDADKLDILSVMLNHFRSGRPNKVVTLGLAPDGDAYTPALLQQLRAGRLGIYEDMRYENDFRLLLLSWVNGLNFSVSRRAFLERGFVRELTAMLPSGGEFDGLAEMLEDRLRA